MASTASSPPSDPPTQENPAIRAVKKRYEGLISIRSKAINGKGAWYWAHLEPILVINSDSNLPHAVKLRCSLCDAVFSASNPSRTASEHLKRGNCASFNSVFRPNSAVSSPLPISSLPSPNRRKRSSDSLALVESTRHCNELTQQPQQNVMLSGGKCDLDALAMLENSIKKLKNPKSGNGPLLSKDQIDSAIELLAEWFYECCGCVSISSLENPKFRSFLHQLGLPGLSRRELLGSRLDHKFQMAKSEVEARIRDAMFFQIACNGWKSSNCCSVGDNEIQFSVNLPNGTSLYQKTVLISGSISSKLAEEIISEEIVRISGTHLKKCVGVIADKYKATALKNLENQYQGMVNLPCQVRALLSLINDFAKELQLFRNVIQNCLKIANFVNNEPQVRARMKEIGFPGLIRVPSSKCSYRVDFMPVFVMVEDILSCARALHMVAIDDGEIAGLVQNEAFWTELNAVYSLIKLIQVMANEIETEQPLVGQCLPLWEDLKAKVKDWSARFNVANEQIEKIVEKRFKKNYHPAWSAAFVLDPVFLIRDSTGKYLPPFKCLTESQGRDVDNLITRLVSKEEAHVALMELMKWRAEGLDPLYARAVQVKQRDPLTGKMRIANRQGGRIAWETWLSEYKTLGKVAVRLIFLQASASGFRHSWASGPMKVGPEWAHKMMFVAGYSKLERKDYLSEEEKDGELFRVSGAEDDMSNGCFGHSG